MKVGNFVFFLVIISGQCEVHGYPWLKNWSMSKATQTFKVILFSNKAAYYFLRYQSYLVTVGIYADLDKQILGIN